MLRIRQPALASLAVGNQIEIGRLNSGTYTSIGSASFTTAPNTRYRMRLRVNGSNLKAKIWLATDAEPGAWMVDVTESSIISAGWSGIFAYLATQNHDFNWVTYATNGGTAPTPTDVTLTAGVFSSSGVGTATFVGSSVTGSNGV